MKKISVSMILKTSSIFILLVILNIGILKILKIIPNDDSIGVMGGSLYFQNYDSLYDKNSQYIEPDDTYIERFLRPSSEKAMDKKYVFDKGGERLPKSFSTAGELVRAYFDILSDASNLVDKKGGCGSVGHGESPYPAAYELLSESLKQNLPYEKFLKSFEGIGHINLLKFVEAPMVKAEETICPKFFVEIETIEGSDTGGKTYFAYYYGYVTAIQEGEKGWKIYKIELNGEDFLCHAYHGWWHDAGTIVDMVYKQRCGVIDKIIGVEEDRYFRNVLAKGKDGKQYRFMFVRITNGADVELRQFVMDNGKWKDIFIDPDKYQEQK